LWLIDWLKWRGIGAIHKTGAKCRFVHPWRLPVTRSQKMPVKGVVVLKPEDLITGCPFLIEAPARRISVPERPPVRQGRFLQHSAQFPAFERIHQQRDLITRLEFVEFPPNPLKCVRTGTLNRIVLDAAVRVVGHFRTLTRKNTLAPFTCTDRFLGCLPSAPSGWMAAFLVKGTIAGTTAPLRVAT
jgi:hypothetical protein